MRQFFRCDKGYVERETWEPDCLITVERPDSSDFEFLTREVGVPEDFLTDSADPDERPRIETDGSWTLTIICIPIATPDAGIPYMTVPVGVITGEGVIVTVCYYKNEIMSDFIAGTRRKSIGVPTRPDFILRLIASSAYWFLHYLKQIQNQVTENEKALEKSVRNEDLLEMMRLEKALVYFNTSLRGNEMLIIRLKRAFSDAVDLDLLEDVEIEMKQALNTVNVYTDILTAAMDAFASIISNNVNAVMKRMTGVTIVLMIPTLIASFYGMNVDISLSSNPMAFVIIIGIAAVLTLLTVAILARMRWF